GFDPEPLYVAGALPRIRFGTWVGGDRDGHPGVTAQITAETLAELRTNAVSVARAQLTDLAAKLSLSTWMQEAPPTLLVALGAAGDMAKHDQPWRRHLEILIAKLPGSGPDSYTYSAELLE